MNTFIDGTEYKLTAILVDGTEVYEPVLLNEEVTIVRVNAEDIPAREVTTLSTPEMDSVVRANIQDSAFRTQKGGSVVR